MNDFIYIIDSKFLFLSADEEISYKHAWKLVTQDITKSDARKKTATDKYSCEYKKIKSYTDLENLIIV